MARYGTLSGAFPLVRARDEVIVEILGRMTAWFSIPLALSILFAAVSTANSIILTLSSMVVRDFFRDREHTWIGRIFRVPFGALYTFAVSFFVFFAASVVERQRENA
jgi:SSS family solute:Na+ symporter